MALAQLPGGVTQDPFKMLDRPVAVALRDGTISLDRPATVLWGRAASGKEEVSVEGVRELTREETAALHRANAPRPGGAPARAVERLKTRHHEIARLMAAGLKDVEIADTLNCSHASLYNLRRSPAFQQLLFYYQAERDVEAMSLSAQIKIGAGLALDKIVERLETEEAASLPATWLKDVMVALLDRAGHSPVQKTATLSAHLSAEDIRVLKEAANAPGTIARIASELPAPTSLGMGAFGERDRDTVLGENVQEAGPLLSRPEVRELSAEEIEAL